MGKNKKKKNRNRAKHQKKQKKTKEQHKDTHSSHDFHILPSVYQKTRDLQQTSETDQNSSIEYERRRQKRNLKYNKNKNYAAKQVSEISSSEDGNPNHHYYEEISSEDESLLLPTDQSKAYNIFQEDFQHKGYKNQHGRNNITHNARKKRPTKQITYSYNKNTRSRHNNHNNQHKQRNLFNLNESSIHPDKVMRQNFQNFEEFEANHEEQESPLISNKKPHNKSKYAHKKLKQQRQNDILKTQKFNKTYHVSARDHNQDKKSRKDILNSLNQRNKKDKHHRYSIEETDEEPSSDPQDSQNNNFLPKYTEKSRHSKQVNSYSNKAQEFIKNKNQKCKMKTTHDQDILKSNSNPMNKQNQKIPNAQRPEIIDSDLLGPSSTWKSQIHQTPEVLGLYGLEYNNHPQIMAEKYLEKQDQPKPTSFLKRHKSFILIVVVLSLFQKVPDFSIPNTSFFKIPDFLKPYLQRESEMTIMLRKIEDLQTLTEENGIQNEINVSNLETQMEEKLYLCKMERSDMEEELEATKAKVDRLEKNFEFFKTKISENSNKHQMMIRKLIEMNQQIAISQVHIYIYICAYYI